MSVIRAAAPVLCFVLFGALLGTPAKADEWNQKTYFTFSAPVEVPGYKGPMVLPAGTYEFKLLDSLTDHDIVQIFNKDQTHLYTTTLAVPDYRLKPTDKSVITFTERAAGAPQAIRAWFYPGMLNGQEFVYPKARAVELAKNTTEPVLSLPNETAANMAKPNKSANESSVQALEKAPVTAEKPGGQEVQLAEVIPPAPAGVETKVPPSSTTSASADLPKTASTMPAWGLIGLLLCAAGFGLRTLARRTS